MAIINEKGILLSWKRIGFDWLNLTWNTFGTRTFTFKIGFGGKNWAGNDNKFFRFEISQRGWWVHLYLGYPIKSWGKWLVSKQL